MAEIKIVKKTPIWPWILAVLAILVVLYFVFLKDNGDAYKNPNDGIETVSDGNSESAYTDSNDNADSYIMAYQTFISEEPKMGLEHEYSHEALSKLIEATRAVADEFGVDIHADLETARTNTSYITKDPEDLKHADKIKNAGNIIVKALGKIQKQKFPDLDGDMDQLQNAVNTIDPGTPTLDQRTVVKDFYQQAGALLKNMKNK